MAEFSGWLRGNAAVDNRAMLPGRDGNPNYRPVSPLSARHRREKRRETG